MRPKISILIPTYRVGGFDVLAQTLARQTERDFEVVIVDHFRSQRLDAVDRFRRLGIRCNHIEPNPCPHPFPIYSGANTFNTGFLACRGKIVVIGCDYFVADADWLANLTRGLGRFEARVGECTYLEPNRDDLDKLVIDPRTWRGSFWSVGRTFRAKPVPESAPYYHVGRFPGLKDGDPLPDQMSYVSKNMAIHRRHVLAVRGMDESYDGGHGQTDIEMGIRLRLAGVSFVFAEAPAAVVRMHEHHVQMQPARTDADITETYLARWDSSTAYYSIYPERSQIRGPAARRPPNLRADHAKLIETGARVGSWTRCLPRWVRARIVAWGLRKRLASQLSPESVQIQLSDGLAWDLNANWKPIPASYAKRPTWGRRWVSLDDRAYTVESVSAGDLRHASADIVVIAADEAPASLSRFLRLRAHEMAVRADGALAFYRLTYERLTGGQELSHEEFVRRFLAGGGVFVPWPAADQSQEKKL